MKSPRARSAEGRPIAAAAEPLTEERARSNLRGETTPAAAPPAPPSEEEVANRQKSLDEIYDLYAGISEEDANALADQVEQGMRASRARRGEAAAARETDRTKYDTAIDRNREAQRLGVTPEQYDRIQRNRSAREQYQQGVNARAAALQPSLDRLSGTGRKVTPEIYAERTEAADKKIRAYNEAHQLQPGDPGYKRTRSERVERKRNVQDQLKARAQMRRDSRRERAEFAKGARTAGMTRKQYAIFQAQQDVQQKMMDMEAMKIAMSAGGQQAPNPWDDPDVTAAGLKAGMTMEQIIAARQAHEILVRQQGGEGAPQYDATPDFKPGTDPTTIATHNKDINTATNQDTGWIHSFQNIPVWVTDDDHSTFSAAGQSAYDTISRLSAMPEADRDARIKAAKEIIAAMGPDWNHHDIAAPGGKSYTWARFKLSMESAIKTLSKGGNPQKAIAKMKQDLDRLSVKTKAQEAREKKIKEKVDKVMPDSAVREAIKRRQETGEWF